MVRKDGKPKHHVCEALKAEAIEKHNQGKKPIKQLAKEYGVTPQALNYWIRAWKKRGRTHKIRFSQELGELEQICNRCGDYWPLDLDFWHHKTNNTGFDFTCRACRHEKKEYKALFFFTSIKDQQMTQKTITSKKQLEQVVETIMFPIVGDETASKNAIPYHLERVTGRSDKNKGWWLVNASGCFVVSLGLSITDAAKVLLALKLSTKLGSSVQFTIADMIESNDILAEMGNLQRKITELEGKRDEQLVAIKQKFGPNIDQIRRDIQQKYTALYHQFGDMERDPKCKTVEFHTGKIGWRKGKASVEILNEEEAINELAKRHGAFLRQTFTINKTAFMDACNTDKKLQDKFCHLRIKDGQERFYVVPVEGKEVKG